MAYASASDVGALCRNLLGAASGFDTSTSPTLIQINSWLSAGCALINATILGRNFQDEIPTDSAAYEFFSMANAQFAAWQAERSRTLASVQATERTRADMFKKDFRDSLDLITMLSLGQSGVSQKQSNVYLGGLTHTDKAQDAGDSDAVHSRFVRGMMSDKTINDETGETVVVNEGGNSLEVS